jgi:hypothetical protein
MTLAVLATVRWDEMTLGHQAGIVLAVLICVGIAAFFGYVAVRGLRDLRRRRASR